MSRSRKKVSIFTPNKAGSAKYWKRSVNKRIRVHNRILIEHCPDWDNLLIMTRNDLSDPYDSPKDDYSITYNKPTNNQCEIDNRQYTWPNLYVLIDGHHKYCNCITNPNGFYWKGFRK